MSKNISSAKELIIMNHTADDVSLLTTNTKKLKINDNLTVNSDEIVLDKNTTINGNLVVSGSLTSETPAIDNNRVLMNSDPNVVADSSLLPIKDPRTAPVSGWYVQNSGANKFNFYYYGKTNLPEVHTFGELKYLYCLAEIISGGNVYFAVYTQRQNDGNDAGSWYRSRHNYVINGTGSTGETGIRMLYTNLKEEPSDIFDSVGRVECTKELFSSVGPQQDDEELLTISLQSDSSAGAGAIEYVIQNFGFKLEHVIQNFCHITDGTGYTEAEIRAFIEGYGYQDEAMVNALIATAVADFETSAEIDARGYLSEAEILAYGWQTSPQVESAIDLRGYLTQPEIQVLIDAAAPVNNFFEGVLSNDVSVNGQDTTWFLNGANGITATEGGSNWDGNVYTVPEDGNYEVKMGVTAETFTDEFKCYLDQLDASSNVEKKYNLDWSSNAYGRMSALTLPTLTAGKKIRLGVYNPDALGKNILGMGSGADRVYEDFEGFALAPISNSVGASIQGGWSGGAQPYFQNDTTDDETIVNTLSVVPGSNSWFTGNVQLYNNPGQGSPHTPKLQIEATAPDEATFNSSLYGKTYNASFWFYSPSANDGDGSVLKVYTGVYLGNDRSGFNVNITKTAGTMTITTFTYAGGAFSPITLDNTLAYDTWHLVEVSINYDAGGNPSNDVYTYTINGGSAQVVNSWPNIWRVDNGFTPTYGTQLAFGEASHLSGWYIDNIEYYIGDNTPEINTHFSIHKI